MDDASHVGCTASLQAQDHQIAKRRGRAPQLAGFKFLPTELNDRLVFDKALILSLCAISDQKMNPERLRINYLDEALGEQERNARLERIIGPQVSMIPGDETSMPGDETSISDGEASIPASKTLKKKPVLSGKGIVICAVLSLATGIVVAAEWQSLSQNLKSYKHDILETIFVATSEGQPAQAAPPPAAVTTPELSEILNRLNAIERSVNELAAGQEQIRKAQSDLAALQSRLVAPQPVANAKQSKQSAPDVTEGRKFPRRDYR